MALRWAETARAVPMITYTPEKLPGIITVKLDGKVVGHIRKGEDGFRYTPKGQRVGGEAFETLRDCKRSIEG